MSLNQKTHGNWNLNLVHGAERIRSQMNNVQENKMVMYLVHNMKKEDGAAKKNVGNIEIAKTDILFY